MIARFGMTRWVAPALFLLASAAGLVACNDGGNNVQLVGNVRSGSAGLAGYTASRYASYVDRAGWAYLGSSVSEVNGAFKIFQ